jgi:hypothetical protein
LVFDYFLRIQLLFVAAFWWWAVVLIVLGAAQLLHRVGRKLRPRRNDRGQDPGCPVNYVGVDPKISC